MKKIAAPLGGAVAGSVVLLLVSVNGYAGEQNAGQMVESKCAYCHSTKRICRVLDDKDAVRWRETVKRMVAKGLVLSETQQKQIVDYLAEVEPSTAGFCGK